MIRIKRGLDIPISGVPRQEVSDGKAIQTVGLVGDDYVGMRPSMLVDEGESVKLGQTLFVDKKTPGVRYTSPGSGTVMQIRRGLKRRFESIVIRIDSDDQQSFSSFDQADLSRISRDQVCHNLIESGMWTAIRTRPFSKVPAIDSIPHSIFVTAMDTNPLAPDAEISISQGSQQFIEGLQLLTCLTQGEVHVCKAAGSTIAGDEVNGIRIHEFAGPHPAGLAGTHIHFLDPVGAKKTVWYLNYQDVIAMGHLFRTGRLHTERVVSLAGPAVTDPRLVRTRVGANLRELTAGELSDEENRLISGSVLCGRQCEGARIFLGRYHQQVSVLQEGRQRNFLGWQLPGLKQYSVMRVFASSLFGRGKQAALTTSRQGSDRPMIPIGVYEKVMPLDVIATFLLRSLIVNDSHQAQQMGCLELDEEDLALCTFVCPGKYDFGEILRRNLTQIERDG